MRQYDLDWLRVLAILAVMDRITFDYEQLTQRMIDWVGRKTIFALPQ
jgi:hypothetical protein